MSKSLTESRPIPAPSASPATRSPAERRAAPRYPVTATAELAELRSGVRISARTADLSQGGCYVDMMSPFPNGTQVKLWIRHKEETFEALGVVCYSQQGMGMGIRFTDIRSEHVQVLHAWLAELSGNLAPVFAAPGIVHGLEQFPRTERAILSRLVSLLIRKKILTDVEGAELLRELTS